MCPVKRVGHLLHKWSKSATAVLYFFLLFQTQWKTASNRKPKRVKLSDQNYNIMHKCMSTTSNNWESKNTPVKECLFSPIAPFDIVQSFSIWLLKLASFVMTSLDKSRQAECYCSINSPSQCMRDPIEWIRKASSLWRFDFPAGIFSYTTSNCEARTVKCLLSNHQTSSYDQYTQYTPCWSGNR